MIENPNHLILLLKGSLGDINELGLEGWELVGVGNIKDGGNMLYFKRPLEE